MEIKTQPAQLDAYKSYIELKTKTAQFLAKNGYLELDLPVLSPALVPESYLEVFKTRFQFMEEAQSLYLAPSPELFIKRFLAHVKQNCYYLGKAFRNSEPDSSRHSPEFTMLEFYNVGATYMDIADEVLALMQYLAGGMEFTYQGQRILLDQWERLTVEDAFIKYAGLEKDVLFNESKLRKHAQKKGYVEDGFSYEDIFSQIYVQEVEPHLGMQGRATLIYDYPKEFAALAQLNTDNKTAQRFEFYIGGVELGDCYTELTDPQEQRLRFEEEDKKRKELARIDHPVDWGFVEALKQGLPPCAGIAIGFERLAMVFSDCTSIHDLRVIDVV